MQRFALPQLMVRAAGLEPAQPFRAEGFSYHFGFRRLAWARSRFQLVCGLDYTFTVARSRVRRCPSSLYTFAPAVRPERLARDCLLPVSPSLGSSAPRVSPGALKLLKSLASTNFATPAYQPGVYSDSSGFSQEASRFRRISLYFGSVLPCASARSAAATAVH
jgi:hypothetical protein